MTPPSSSRSKPTSADEVFHKQFGPEMHQIACGNRFRRLRRLQIDRLDRSIGCRTYVEEGHEYESVLSQRVSGLAVATPLTRRTIVQCGDVKQRPRDNSSACRISRQRAAARGILGTSPSRRGQVTPHDRELRVLPPRLLEVVHPERPTDRPAATVHRRSAAVHRRHDREW